MLQRVFNNQSVRVRESDKFLSANDMLEAVGKRRDKFSQWAKGEAASAHISVVSSVTLKIGELIDTVTTGPSTERGTWIHPDIALRFAMDLDANFGYQVILWVRELMTTGSVNLADSLDPVTGELKSLKEQYNRLEKEKDYYPTVIK